MTSEDSAEQMPATLKLGGSLLRRGHMAALMAGLVGLPLLALALILAIAAVCAGTGSLGSFVADALRQALQDDPSLRYALWALAVLTPLLVVFFLGQRSACLRLGPAGLQADIPRWLGVGLTRQTAGQWRIGWESIRSARLVLPPGGRNVVQTVARSRLAIGTERGETWLAPFIWYRAAGPDHRLGLGELLRHRRLDPHELLARTPLLRALAARGVPLSQAEPVRRGPAGFDLARHPGLLAQIAVAGLAGLYAVADGFFLGLFQPLEPLPLSPFALAGAGAALAAAVLGRGAPRLERWVIGVLAVAAVTAAAYPATLRLNALTAQPELVVYRAVAPGRFEDPAGRRPPVDLTGQGVEAYWAQYPPGAQHSFTLLRGVAGLHQLDLEAFYRRTRAFYRARAATEPAAGQ